VKKRRILMDYHRQVKKAMSVFDVTIGKALNLEECLCTRVLLIYDEQNNKREFKVLDPMMTRDLSSRIETWLANNVHIPTFIAGLKADESFDADDPPAW
jgi:hypothetical protein